MVVASSPGDVDGGRTLAMDVGVGNMAPSLAYQAVISITMYETMSLFTL